MSLKRLLEGILIYCVSTPKMASTLDIGLLVSMAAMKNTLMTEEEKERVQNVYIFMVSFLVLRRIICPTSYCTANESMVMYLLEPMLMPKQLIMLPSIC